MLHRLLLWILITLNAGAAAAQQTAPLNILTVAGSTLTYATGSVSVNGVLQTYPAGSLSGFTASMTDCSQASIVAGTAKCNYIYMPAAGGALQTSSAMATAFPYVLAWVTTAANGNIQLYAPWNPPVPTALLESQSLLGMIFKAVAAPSSATPVFDASQGTVQYNVVTQNVTSSTIINPVDGMLRLFSFFNTGAFTVAWPANMAWNGGSPPVTSGANTAFGGLCYYSAGAAKWECVATWTNLH
jgi:hypothetical protein